MYWGYIMGIVDFNNNMALCAFRRSAKGDYLLRGTKDEYVITQSNYSNAFQKSAHAIAYQCKNLQGEEFIIKQFQNTDIYVQIKNKEVKLLEDAKADAFPNVECIHDYAEDKINFYLVESIKSSTLTQMIFREEFKNQFQVLQCIRQIANGIQTLHKYNIQHRDINSDNILVLPNKASVHQCKNYFTIGYCIAFKPTHVLEHSISFSTKSNYAPEQDSDSIGEQADIYSLGCILLRIIASQHTFASSIDSIRKSKINQLNINSKCGPLSKFMLRVLEGCLQCSSLDRISSNELFNILMVDTLYKPTPPLLLDEVDACQSICVKGFPRMKELLMKKKTINKNVGEVNICMPQRMISTNMFDDLYLSHMACNQKYEVSKMALVNLHFAALENTNENILCIVPKNTSVKQSKINIANQMQPFLKEMSYSQYTTESEQLVSTSSSIDALISDRDTGEARAYKIGVCNGLLVIKDSMLDMSISVPLNTEVLELSDFRVYSIIHNKPNLSLVLDSDCLEEFKNMLKRGALCHI